MKVSVGIEEFYYEKKLLLGKENFWNKRVVLGKDIFCIGKGKLLKRRECHLDRRDFY